MPAHSGKSQVGICLFVPAFNTLVDHNYTSKLIMSLEHWIAPSVHFSFANWASIIHRRSLHSPLMSHSYDPVLDGIVPSQ